MKLGLIEPQRPSPANVEYLSPYERGFLVTREKVKVTGPGVISINDVAVVYSSEGDETQAIVTAALVFNKTYTKLGAVIKMNEGEPQTYQLNCTKSL